MAEGTVCRCMGVKWRGWGSRIGTGGLMGGAAGQGQGLGVNGRDWEVKDRGWGSM